MILPTVEKIFNRSPNMMLNWVRADFRSLAANRNAVKLHLHKPVQQGYLEQHGTDKGTWYSVGR